MPFFEVTMEGGGGKNRSTWSFHVTLFERQRLMTTVSPLKSNTRPSDPQLRRNLDPGYG